MQITMYVLFVSRNFLHFVIIGCFCWFTLIHTYIHTKHHIYVIHTYIHTYRWKMCSRRHLRNFGQNLSSVSICSARACWRSKTIASFFLLKSVITYIHAYIHTYRSELLDITEDLFGPQQDSLFSEFKRLLNNRADFDENRGDIWYGCIHIHIHTYVCI